MYDLCCDCCFKHPLHSHSNNFLDCIENSVTAFCGSEAGAWQREFETRLIERALATSGCELDDGENLVIIIGDDNQESKNQN